MDDFGNALYLVREKADTYAACIMFLVDSVVWDNFYTNA